MPLSRRTGYISGVIVYRRFFAARKALAAFNAHFAERERKYHTVLYLFNRFFGFYFKAACFRKSCGILAGINRIYSLKQNPLGFFLIIAGKRGKRNVKPYFLGIAGSEQTGFREIDKFRRRLFHAGIRLFYIKLYRFPASSVTCVFHHSAYMQAVFKYFRR